MVAEADDSTSLILACKRHQPDIIILDLDIENSKNIRLIEDILDIDVTMAIVVISEPTHMSSEIVLMAGARAYIQKPFTTYDLIDVMRKVSPLLRKR